MDALLRQEYPAMLERLTPASAVMKFNERVKRIGKVNLDIAEWLLERRKVEDQYVSGLKKLARKPLQDVGGDLGVFEGPWRKILESTEGIAKSHALLSDRIDKDVEQPLRSFASTNREMVAMPTIQGNLSAMAKELEDAQEKSEKLSKKAGKASTQKVDAATTRLQSATQQWESQAPFIMENLQALDERRLNHLRDVLTQYETHEADLVERNRKTVEETLTALLEIDTSKEIQNWAAVSVAGLPITERRARQLSSVGTENTGNASLPPPPQTPRSTHTTHTDNHTDNQSQHSQSARQDTMESNKEREREKEPTLKSRFGTMLGRRRQSIHGGFRAPSPNKGFVPFGRGTSSRDGRPSPSPRTSSNNLRESPSRNERLSSLAESPTGTSPAKQTNGTHNPSSSLAGNSMAGRSSANGPSAADIFDVSDVSPPPGPPPSHSKAVESQKDSEGFNVPAPMNDPISQAEHDAYQESDQPQFKLDIRKEPIPEQDADAQAALSNVANTLRSANIPAPSRKSGTVRGRRDVRNTVYLPAQNSHDVAMPDIPPSPGIPAGRAAALAALSSESHGAPSGSDTTSIRSGHSLTNHAAMKHADMYEPGLNASIIETVSTSFENGETKSMKISGEIALSHNSADDLPSSSSETIRIDNFPNLEAIGPNKTFIIPVSDEKPDEFALNLEYMTSKPTPAFTYRVHIDDADITTHAPLLIKVAWKKQGSDKLGLVLEYSLNPACGSGPVTFNNLVLVAIYEGARASACQTKPTGTHLKEKSLVYWRLGDMVLTNEWHKVICRFVGAEGAVPEAGHIEARWEINISSRSGIGSGISLSKLEASKGKEKEEDDPFADETTSPNTASSAGIWKEIPTHKKFVSGKYEAKQL